MFAIQIVGMECLWKRSDTVNMVTPLARVMFGFLESTWCQFKMAGLFQFILYNFFVSLNITAVLKVSMDIHKKMRTKCGTRLTSDFPCGDMRWCKWNTTDPYSHVFKKPGLECKRQKKFQWVQHIVSIYSENR